MKYYKHSFIAFFAVAVLGTPWLISSYPSSMNFIDNIFGYVETSYANYSAVFFQKGITVDELHDKYNSGSKNKIRIMIVPGHEPDFGGAEYGSVKEREIAVDLANNLRDFLRDDPHYDVIVSRDKDNWNPVLSEYFKDHWSEITSFVKESKEQMIRLVNDGSVKKMDNNVIHNTAPQNVALRLYGINKWNNENNVDMAIHIHFNDYPRNNKGSPGAYNGFAIYVPEKQYSNSYTTHAIAENVFKRLSKYNAVSNLPKEDDGLIEEQELIAIGSHNTLDAPSMLIEYSYIYEPQITDPDTRAVTLKDLAFQTYLGIQDFFGAKSGVAAAYDTLMLPHNWQSIDQNSKDKSEILALQTVLMAEGIYPPNNRSKNDCPRTGRFGPCTMTALKIFQDKYGIKDEVNVVGEQTKKVLNNNYSQSIR